MQDGDECVLCDQASETVEHLVLGCVVTRELWASLLLPIGLVSLVPERGEPIAGWWLHQRERIDTAARPMFDSVFLLIAWTILKEEQRDLREGTGQEHHRATPCSYN